MNVYSIFDPHCFVWDKDDYQNNQSKYYSLLDELIEFIDILEREDELIYFMRPEIIWEITNSFPANLIDETLNRNDLWDKQTIIYSFLSRKLDNFVEYENTSEEVQSYPDFIKDHYNDNLKEELKILLTAMLSNDNDNLVVLSLDKLCGDEEKLVLSDSRKQRGFKLYKTPYEIEQSFSATRNKFLPSPKHNDPDGWGTILPKFLEEECYSLINSAIIEENTNSTALYAYSRTFQTYIVFRLTIGIEYHAYPVEPDEVPSTVRRKFQALHS